MRYRAKILSNRIIRNNRMFDDISFDTDDDKWKWISILSGMGIGILTTGIMIGCYCKGCIIKSREKETARRTRVLYNQKEIKQISTPPIQPSAPPSTPTNILSRVPSTAPPSYGTNQGVAVPIQTPTQIYNVNLRPSNQKLNPHRKDSFSV